MSAGSYCLHGAAAPGVSGFLHLFFPPFLEIFSSLSPIFTPSLCALLVSTLRGAARATRGGGARVLQRGRVQPPRAVAAPRRRRRTRARGRAARRTRAPRGARSARELPSLAKNAQKLVRTLPKVLKYLPGDKAADEGGLWGGLVRFLGRDPAAAAAEPVLRIATRCFAKIAVRPEYVAAVQGTFDAGQPLVDLGLAGPAAEDERIHAYFKAEDHDPAAVLELVICYCAGTKKGAH